MRDMMFDSWETALEKNSKIARALSGQDLESFRVATVAAGTHVTQMSVEDLQNQSEPARWAKDALAESVSMLEKSIKLAAKAGVALPEEMNNWHGSLPELSHLWN